MAGARIRTPAQQLFGLAQLPVTTTVAIKCGRLRWEGRLQPTPRSDTYAVRIEYASQSHPEVTIIAPRLEVPKGVFLPHTFTRDRLCLYWRGQWDGSMSIARTIVPWTSEWLLYYELWQFTGTWLGGGHEPGDSPKPRREKQREDPAQQRVLRKAA
jgi:hypothetical protein